MNRDEQNILHSAGVSAFLTACLWLIVGQYLSYRQQIGGVLLVWALLGSFLYAAED
jgi:hypothetical protein